MFQLALELLQILFRCELREHIRSPACTTALALSAGTFAPTGASYSALPNFINAVAVREGRNEAGKKASSSEKEKAPHPCGGRALYVEASTDDGCWWTTAAIASLARRIFRVVPTVGPICRP